MGVALAASTNLVFQISLPVRASNAWKRQWILAPINTSPPAVTIGPPRCSGVPVLGTPSASNSSNDPRGTRHATSPVLTLTATISPHGGGWHGHFLPPSQNLPP